MRQESSHSVWINKKLGTNYDIWDKNNQNNKIK